MVEMNSVFLVEFEGMSSLSCLMRAAQGDRRIMRARMFKIIKDPENSPKFQGLVIASKSQEII